MGLEIKGISYTTSEEASQEAVAHDLRAIREDLHCTTVMLIGTDVRAQMAAAEQALDLGLDVWIRPYLANRPRSQLLSHLREMGEAAEELRTRHPERVTLLVGSEFSLTQRGAIPGPHLFLRLQVLRRPRLMRLLRRRINRKVNSLIRETATTARKVFQGPITYAAGYWEEVDWSVLDIIGVNLYRMGNDPQAYEERLAGLLRDAARKPVVITEFGCGAHRGADRRGPGSFMIVKWLSARPHVRDGHTRDEAVQARYLAELIDLYEARDVHGCFAFTFSMPEFVHTDDPRHDLDMAGFGVVKFRAGADRWEAKEAFRAVAERYGVRAS